MNTRHSTSTPPPIPFAPIQLSSSQTPKRAGTGGRVFSITSLAICGIGIFPMLVFVAMALDRGNLFAVLIMGFIGFVIHMLGVTSGIIGAAMGVRAMGLLGAIGNAVIILLCLLTFLLAISGL